MFRKHTGRATILKEVYHAFADFNVLFISFWMQVLLITVVTRYLNLVTFKTFPAAVHVYHNIALWFGDGQ
jgi:hypothetical protein